MRWRVAALVACGLACGAPARRPSTHVAPWLRADPQRCLIRRDLSEGMEEMARHCAEAFVRENGYTDLPADDPSRWVREADEGDRWSHVLAARSGTLDSRATSAQCSARRCVVLFRDRRSLLLCAFRAVTMTQVFTKLRVAPGRITDARCGERRV